MQKSTQKKILVLLEPNSNLSNDFSIDFGMEIEIVEKALQINKKEGYDGLIIRPHPSKLATEFNLEKLAKIDSCITVSTNFYLEDDLRVSILVLGFNSYGLYLSSMSGIETKSYFTGSSNHWTNHWPQITSIH